MTLVAVGVLLLQALIMLVDELYFHRRREVPRWERIGHPLDTLSLLGCCALALTLEPTRGALVGYAALGAFSCLLVTKDEFVHSRHCRPGEHWLHALLFVLHPLVLLAVAVLWFERARALLVLQTAAVAGFGLYQVVYWNLLAPPAGVERRLE